MTSGDPTDGEVPAGTSGRTSIGNLATKGVATVFGRGILVRAIGLAGTLVTARILGPSGLGLLAVGFSINVAATALTDGGLGSGLIRRKEDPTVEQLGSVLGFQLALGVGLALAVAAIGIPFGRLGQVTALMIWCVPAMSLRTPAVVLAERDISYGRQARADVAQAVVSNGLAIVLLLLGAGVWGVAAATVLGALTCGLLTMLSIPGGRVRPVLSIAPIRDVLAFGVQLQASQIAGMARDQGLNLGIAAIGGTAMLGIWSLATRLLQIPYLLLNSLWRVSFPAMSKRINEGGDSGEVVERTIRMSGLALGILVAPLGASSTVAVPMLFGQEWAPTGRILVPICVVLATTGAISVGCAAFLGVVGRVRSMLWVTIANGVTWLTITLGLLRPVGAMAIPLGFAAASTLESIGFAWICRSEANARPGLTALRCATPAIVGGALGFGVARLVEGDVAATAASALVATVATLGAARLIEPAAFRELVGRVQRVASRAI